MIDLSTLTAVLVGIATLYAALYYLQFYVTRPDEPPVVPAPGLPFFGHVFGMVVDGGRYLQQLGIRLQYQPRGGKGAGIFTLPVPGSRIYFVTDPAMAAAAQRAARTMSFEPLAPIVTRRVLGFDDATYHQGLVGDNLRIAMTPTKNAAGGMSVIDASYNETVGFMADTHDLVYEYLSKADTLNALVLSGARELAGRANAFAAGMESSLDTDDGDGAPAPAPIVHLLDWVKQMVTAGTAQFMYGPQNPLAQEPALTADFWEFVHGVGWLMLVGDSRPGSLAATLLGGRPYRARERVVAGFTRYLDAGLGATGSPLVQRRLEVPQRHAWSVDGTARSELSFLFAGIINTAVTSFWVVLQLLADPVLLQRVRAELGDGDPASGGPEVATISIEHIRTGCPVLQAVYNECLRLGSNTMSSRLVLTDTVLADCYFLRAGAVVQIASGVLHADPAVWGTDPHAFAPEHHLGCNKTAEREKTRSFRPFGGGKTLCPGRHFATAEIMAFAAALVLLFDADDATAGVPPNTPPPVPPRNYRVLPVHLSEPEDKAVPRVRLKLRQPGRRIEVVP